MRIIFRSTSDECGELRQRIRNWQVMNGPRGFENDLGFAVVQKVGNFGGVMTTQREDNTKPASWRRAMRGFDQLLHILCRAGQAHHRAVAKDSILIVVRSEQFDQRGNRGRLLHIAEGYRGEVLHARLAVLEQLYHRIEGSSKLRFAEQLRGLSANFGIIGRSQIRERRQQRCRILSTPSQLTDAPDRMNAREG